VCDNFDKCPGEDDNADADGNGVADCEEKECIKDLDRFDVKKLVTNKSPEHQHTTKTFEDPV